MPKFTYNFPSRRPLLDISVGTTAARLTQLTEIGQGVNGPCRWPRVQALLDTGASMTTVDQSIIDRLKLAPSGQVQFFSNGELESKPTNCYEACITILPPLFGQPGQSEERIFDTIRIAAGTLKNDLHGFEGIGRARVRDSGESAREMTDDHPKCDRTH
jgi:hypothetical protein